MRDFFGLKKAEGLLKAKKIPKTARRPKQAWLKQNKFFVLPNDEKCRALTLKCHFFKYSKLFPLQKVKFLVPKIPIGEKSFLCCKARKTRVRARNKKRAILKKVAFFDLYGFFHAHILRTGGVPRHGP